MRRLTTILLTLRHQAQDRMGVDLRGILHTVLPEDASQSKL